MTKRICLLSAAWVLGGLLVAGGISGCGGSSGGGAGQSDNPTTRLVATWRLVKLSGGFGGPPPPTPDPETLTFKSNGTFTRTVSGDTVTGTYTVTQRKTIFSEQIVPVITYNYTTLPEVVTLVDSQHLSTNDEATDGYYREYEKVTP